MKAARAGFRLAESLMIGMLTLVIGCVRAERDSDKGLAAARDRPEYVGREVCARCHQHENRVWRGSHHDLSMQEVSEQTVLGDFDDTSISYGSVTSTFFKVDGRFFVRTDDADGKLRDFEIRYSVGAVPLQQYLIELPGGHLQALSICWDTRPEEQGGQRWFHLYPDQQIDHSSELHWTGRLQNWSSMCAECHSTNVKKNYRVDQVRYDTTWSEIDVACEACHGPGSGHVSWAKAVTEEERARYDNGHLGLVVRLEDPGRGTWMISRETAGGMRLAPPVATSETETCARCHSRRLTITEDYVFGRPLTDTHNLALLEEELYHADGQVLGEVYVYGSFLQSSMHRQGVTCSDCHDPHSLGLHFPGDAVCFRCHSQARFATPEHHFHDPGTTGSFCVDCHMPPRHYMVIDPRHDHGMRIPRPDLSSRIGTPNACNGCHQERSAEWSAQRVKEWYGHQGRSEWHWGEAIHAGRIGKPGAEGMLQRLIGDAEIPAIARATALTLLPSSSPGNSVDSIENALRDDDPLVRIGAIRALDGLGPADRSRLAPLLLGDVVRMVRMEAARTLANVPGAVLTPRQRELLSAGLEEYRTAQRVNSERCEAHLNLGALAAQLGDLVVAERSYETALRIDPAFLPAYVNLADLYRLQARDADGVRILSQALKRAPHSADLHHALGLALVRQGRLREAVAALGRAAELRPDAPRYVYAYALALSDSGDRVRALDALEQAHQRFPADRELLLGLVTLHRESGAADKALDYARQFLELSPGEPEALEVVEAIEAETGEGM